MKKAVLKRVLSVVCSASFIMTGCGKSDSSSSEKPKVYNECEKAQVAVDKFGAGWNLGNTLDATGGSRDDIWGCETSWGNPYTTKEMITTVKDAGFNAIRVPITWENHIDDDGTVDKEWMDRVQEVVDYVVSQDLYCIINVHHDGGENGWVNASNESYEKNGDKFAKIWEQVADRFKDYDEKLLFESINEILDKQNNWSGGMRGESAEAVTKYTQRFVDTVRAGEGYNKTRNLVIMTYAGAYSRIKQLEIPNDSAQGHLIIEVHDYDPQGFCWRNATWTNMTDEWGSDDDKKAIDDSMKQIGDAAKEKGLPVIIGEYGSQDKEGNEDARAVHAGYFTKAAKENGIKCFWWDCEAFAVIDRDYLTVKCPKIVDAIMEAVK